MKNTYFVDTSYILALEVKKEQYHQKVLENWLSLSLSQPFLVTTTYIFDEIVTLLNSRKLHNKAVEVGTRLIESSDINLIEIEQNLFLEGWEYLKQSQDKSYSLTDCISFIVMRKYNIYTALSLDHHFEQAGFQKLP